MNYAYVTLLSSEDYLPAILVLNRNLKKLNCKFPLYVMVTNDIIFSVQKYLNAEQILFTVVPKLDYSTNTINYYQNEAPTALKTASKIQLFKLTQFDKVVYLDADSIFLKSPDELFMKYDGSIYEDVSSNSGFSGLFVCNPRNHYFDYYYTLLKTVGGLDGDLFAHLWFPYKDNLNYHIDFKWFIHIMCVDDSLNLNDIYGVHFCYKVKPWNYTDTASYIHDLTIYTHKNENNNREKIVNMYINEYLLPIKNQYKI